MNKFLTLLTFLFTTLALHAAEPDWTDSFFRDGKYRVVAVVLAIIFVGIIVYLVRLDRKIGQIERELKNK